MSWYRSRISIIRCIETSLAWAYLINVVRNFHLFLAIGLELSNRGVNPATGRSL